MNDTRFYYDYHYPLSLVGFIRALGDDPNAAHAPSLPTDTAAREWFSNPALAAEGHTEVVVVKFRLPLSVSQISMEILRTPTVVEVWYRDRTGNVRPVLDSQRTPLVITVARSDTVSYHRFTSTTYPIVATQIQFRLRRLPDPALDTVPFVVGLRNCLIRRNVYERADGQAGFEDEQDVLGSVVSRYIKDWDAPRAVDDEPYTFWRSGPMPDPSAVCSLYLDIRTADGGAQTIDGLYLDPVYAGPHLNLYYSTDDTVGVRRLNPVSLIPPPPLFDEDGNVLEQYDVNTRWEAGTGRADIAPTDAVASYYRWPMAVGALNGQAAWIGVEWRPGFGQGDAVLAAPAVLLGVLHPAGPAFSPVLSYDSGSGEFVLEFTDGTEHRRFAAALDADSFAAGDSLRVVTGWRYDPNAVVVSVVNGEGRTLVYAEFDGSAAAGLPDSVSFDGVLQMHNFRGVMGAHLIKIGDYRTQRAEFQFNPAVFTCPDPVLPDGLGETSTTTLDDAIYAACWDTQEHGSGGSDDSHFADKVWNPVWRDFVCQKGVLRLPRAVRAKYLKCEFTNLVEEPYPVYESGIEVKYKVFPASVFPQAGAAGAVAAYLGSGTFVKPGGLTAAPTVNWMNRSSVLRAAGMSPEPTLPPIPVADSGNAYITETLPGQGNTVMLMQDQQRLETASAYVYRRDGLQPYILAETQYQTIIRSEGLQFLDLFGDVPWQEIADANPGKVSPVRSSGMTAVRGADWWIFPGQQLKIPAATMQKLTMSSTVTERRNSLEYRVRFATASVHRYDIRTATRDAGVAYFAGVREVAPVVVSHVTGEDPSTFDFPFYDLPLWTATPTDFRRLDAGPVSKAVGMPGFAELGREFITASTFNKVTLEFRDSGLLRSDPMWTDITPDSQSIDDLQLSYNVRRWPVIPGGTWNDSTVVWGTKTEADYPGTLGPQYPLEDRGGLEWNERDAMWGTPFSAVRVWLDGTRMYQGNRVLRFRREKGAGDAGIILRQSTHILPGGLFRMRMLYNKPTANSNDVTLRLRRRVPGGGVGNGDIVYQEAFKPRAGRWSEYVSRFVEVPAAPVEGTFYELMLTLSGSDAEDFDLANLYTEISQIRYFVNLGIDPSPVEVTDLHYGDGTVCVSATQPVNRFAVQARVYSDEAFAFSAKFTPNYLK